MNVTSTNANRLHPYHNIMISNLWNWYIFLHGLTLYWEVIWWQWAKLSTDWASWVTTIRHLQWLDCWLTVKLGHDSLYGSWSYSLVALGNIALWKRCRWSTAKIGYDSKETLYNVWNHRVLAKISKTLDIVSTDVLKAKLKTQTKHHLVISQKRETICSDNTLC